MREAIAEEMRHDEKVFLIGEDIGVPGGFGGAFGVYLGLPEEFGHDRIIDTPISEKAIAGAAVGAALMGMRPIADLQYADFLFECMDELVNQAAKMRYMSNGKLSVPMVMRCPVGTANRGAQHGQCPESYFVHVPGLKVVCVSDAYHAKGLLKSAVRDNDPVLFFEHKLLYGSKGREQAGGMNLTAHVPEDEYLFPIGKAVVKREGTSVTVVATHMSLYRSLAAAEELAQDGIECEVIDPADAAAVRRGDDLRVGEEDRPARDCPRGHAHRRMGRRACGASRRGMPLLIGGAHPESGEPRRADAGRTRHGADRGAVGGEDQSRHPA